VTQPTDARSWRGGDPTVVDSRLRENDGQVSAPASASDGAPLSLARPRTLRGYTRRHQGRRRRRDLPRGGGCRRCGSQLMAICRAVPPRPGTSRTTRRRPSRRNVPRPAWRKRRSGTASSCPDSMLQSGEVQRPRAARTVREPPLRPNRSRSWLPSGRSLRAPGCGGPCPSPWPSRRLLRRRRGRPARRRPRG